MCVYPWNPCFFLQKLQHGHTQNQAKVLKKKWIFTIMGLDWLACPENASFLYVSDLLNSNKA